MCIIKILLHCFLNHKPSSDFNVNKNNREKNKHSVNNSMNTTIVTSGQVGPKFPHIEKAGSNRHCTDAPHSSHFYNPRKLFKQFGERPP